MTSGRRPVAPRTELEMKTLGELQDVYRDADLDRLLASMARDDAIRAALEDGWTHQQISTATGLSRGRIGQIAGKT